MNLLVSDYDGTIKCFNDIPSNLELKLLFNNIRLINKYRRENLFIISTGRTTKSIISEIDKYRINCDYIQTFDGLVTTNKNLDMISVKYLNLKYISEIIEIVNKLSNIKRIKYANVLDYCDYCTKPILMGIMIENNLIISELINYLNTKYTSLNIEYCFKNNYIWIKQKCNKSIAIKNLIKIKKDLIGDNNNIFTIGNEKNDIEMINDFNGKMVHNENDFSTYIKKLIKNK